MRKTWETGKDRRPPPRARRPPRAPPHAPSTGLPSGVLPMQRITRQCVRTLRAPLASAPGLGRGLASVRDDVPYALSPAQRVFVAGYAALGAFADPRRDDLVAILGEATGGVALQACRDRMAASETGAELLRDRPEIDNETIAAARLADLPEGTFGRAYHAFMDGHGFDADGRKPVRFVEDEELRYVMLRYRQVHDFWHVLVGLPPTVLGELGLKWFEMVQTGLPMAALASLAGPMRLSEKKRAIFYGTYVPWAQRSATAAEFLLNVKYEDMWDVPLDEMRRSLRLEPAPRV